MIVHIMKMCTFYFVHIHEYFLNFSGCWTWTPYCFGCDTLFTVRHFLLECGDFSHIRNKYFHADTIKQLFNDVPNDNVFLFLKEINLFNKL